MSQTLIFEVDGAKGHEGDFPLETKAAELVVKSMPTSGSEVTESVPIGDLFEDVRDVGSASRG